MNDGVRKEMLRQMHESIRARVDSSAEDSPYKCGLRLFQNHEFEGAAEYFNRSIKLNPNFAFAYYYAGRSYRNFCRYAEAKAMFERSIGLNPFHASSHAYLGDIFLTEERSAEGEKCFRKAAELQFDNEMALKGLARLARQKQIEIKSIAEMLRNAYFQGDRNPMFLMELFSLQTPDLGFCFNLADELFRKQSFRRAAFFYRSALSCEPNNEMIRATYKECLEILQHTST